MESALDIREKDFKIRILIGITLVFTTALILRLFYIQIFQYKTIVQRAQYSTSRISVLSAPRGIIYDQNGKILATNKQAISLIVYPNKLRTLGEKLEVYNRLIKILKHIPKKLKQTLVKLPDDAPLPIRLQSNISIEEAIQIVEKQYILPGVSIQQEPIRYYPNGPLAAHLLGYISQIDEKELLQRPERKLGDLVGKYGIEKLFDNILRGSDGKTIVEIDRFGKPINPDYEHAVIHVEPKPGRNIYLTIDLELQKVAEEALKKMGTGSSVIVVNPNNGEVLALASYPDFDPNIFTKPLSVGVWKNLVSKKAFLNRAILSYVPGSIWKPVVLLSALDSMVVLPNEKFNVSGAFYLGKTRFGDWTSKTGVLSLEECLAWSRDTAFYQIGRRLTPDQIRYWGVKLGGGRKTGIELLGEEKGIIPDEKWKLKNIGEPWYPGNTLHYAIGQSFLLLTPTQVARIYSGIATGSKVPKLNIVKRIDNYTKQKELPERFTVDPTALRVVRDGLERCVDSGTGVASKLETVKIAGKTGSAEVPGTGRTHGWFAAYAPAYKPELVVVAIAEKAGHGGTVAAPIAKKIFEKYFDKHKVIANSSSQHLNLTSIKLVPTAPPTLINKNKAQKKKPFGLRLFRH